MRYSLMICSLALVAMLGTACRMAGVETRTDGLAFPVLVGPVDRIGGEPGERELGRLISNVEGEVSHSLVMSSSSEDHGSYTETTTTREENWDDDIAFSLNKEAGSSDRVVHLDAIKAGATSHVSLFAYGCQFIDIEGQVYQRECGKEVASLPK